MKKPYQQAGQASNKQPSQSEIQSLMALYNAGHLPQAEQAAKAMLGQYPQALIVHNVLGVALEGQKKFIEAAQSYRQTLAIQPKIAEIHFNLGAVLGHLGQHEQAIASYRKAIELKPSLTDAHFNLGTTLQAQGNLEQAVACYRKAIALQPGYFEAYGNLGTVLQQQGKLEEAVACYRKALAIHADAKGFFNLATALRDQGKLDDALANYRNALAIAPDYAEAHNNLGETLRDQGKMDEAILSYQQALAINPAYAEASYNMAQFLYDAGNLEQAIAYFEKSELADWQERILYSLYKTGQYDQFQSRLQPLLAAKHTSPFLATLTSHYALNFGVQDPYNFCKMPIDFVYHNRIEALATESSELLSDLLRDINFAAIAERKQGRLHHGIQSAGNLFKRPEASFKKLAALIKLEIEAYRQRFIAKNCELMLSFPAEIEFSSSWYVKMRQGGHLSSHIHETGWLSGSVYLTLPKDKLSQHDGSIEFSMHGDNYPQQHSNFPTKTIAPAVGDIVLFPSSLFHRTVPFSSQEERICVAFDLKPATASYFASTM